MAGKTRTPGAPSWFDPNAYRAAERLDAGDWLLNLTLRRWLHQDPDQHTEAALRSAGPVLRRGDEAQIKAMHVADRHRWVDAFKSDAWGDSFEVHEAFEEACNRPSLPPDVWHALSTGRVRSGVWPLGVVEMYVFERKLPAAVRKAGARFAPGDSGRHYPDAFRGKLDDAFGPTPAHQMLGRFVRVDLQLPDDVLHADFQHYLKAERHRLAAMGGPQPYREAARLKLISHALGTLANLHLLQFLDLNRWQKAEALGLSFYPKPAEPEPNR